MSTADTAPGGGGAAGEESTALRLLPQTTRWRWVTGITVVVVAYASLMLAYGFGTRDVNNVPVPMVPSGGVAVHIDVRAVDTSTRSMTVVVAIEPDDNLLDSDDFPITPISVYLQPVQSGADISWSTDRHIDARRTVLELDGDIQDWPFDTCTARPPVGAQAYSGSPGQFEVLPTAIGITGDVPGWHFDLRPNPGLPQQLADTSVRRTIAIIGFGLLLVVVLIALSGLALFVAVSCLRGRRKIEPNFLAWIGAMLFATVPIRNFLPGSPPPGSWVDIAVVLWAIVGLAVALILGAMAWWRWNLPVRLTVDGDRSGRLAQPDEAGR